MNFTRKNLKLWGVPEEAIDAVIEAHSEVVESIKQERDSYAEKVKQVDETKAKYDEVVKENSELKQQLAEAKKNGGDAQKIQEAFDTYKQQIETEKKTASISAAAKKLLINSGMKEMLADLVLSKRGLDGIELDDNGAIKDSDKLISAIKGDYGDLFASKRTDGTPATNPPAGGDTKPHGSGRAAALAAQYQKDMYSAPSKKGE